MVWGPALSIIGIIPWSLFVTQLSGGWWARPVSSQPLGATAEPRYHSRG